eukprot:scaffold27521_cov30-Tisochrysis_lutea.AAC.12
MTATERHILASTSTLSQNTTFPTTLYAVVTWEPAAPCHRFRRLAPASSTEAVSAALPALAIAWPPAGLRCRTPTPLTLEPSPALDRLRSPPSAAPLVRFPAALPDDGGSVAAASERSFSATFSSLMRPCRRCSPKNFSSGQGPDGSPAPGSHSHSSSSPFRGVGRLRYPVVGRERPILVVPNANGRTRHLASRQTMQPRLHPRLAEGGCAQRRLNVGVFFMDTWLCPAWHLPA